MDEGKWDLHEIKRLRKKQLLHTNLMYLLFYISFGIYIELGGSSIVLLGIASAVLWLLLAKLLFTLRTGKVVGTKATQRIEAFDRERLGERRWKRSMVIGLVILFALSAGSTVALFVLDLGKVPLAFPEDSFALIGAWLGINIGEIHRIRKLSLEISRKSQEQGPNESF